jgi:hypothetical protein
VSTAANPHKSTAAAAGFRFEQPVTRRIWKVADLMGEVRVHTERTYVRLLHGVLEIRRADIQLVRCERADLPLLKRQRLLTLMILLWSNGGPLGRVGSKAARREPALRPPAALYKDFGFKTLRENADVQFRAEAFNLLNTPQFSNPDTGQSDFTFGEIQSTSVAPHILQFALKLSF